jgi:lipid-A-disaccharide synthase-like uncharacterized protein
MQWLELREASRGIRPALFNFAGLFGVPLRFQIARIRNLSDVLFDCSLHFVESIILMGREIKDI